ncbi:Crp/Fnr family transcriptional regulator [Tropicibacter sp. R16_0]|uniref:Crp/Fnr family transcriptional regulator n=1 Tax=Tropicibacter sp. R16_0 TaxID=2821102 RepID=UPI001ADCD0DC|nr:Crp/Fnr family transcriptional regulator [Tropicibacter sp. R16_0]MBO9450042.1 Crp/Fnr family transcriptional regulator [Tropicibacter sp. R16_0]
MTSLPETGFLAQASDRLKAMLSSQATEIDLDRGAVLFEQGDDGDALYAITQGSLEFSILSQNGRKLSLDLMGPGAIFGEIALFDPGPRTATVTAIDPAKVLRVRSSDVLAQIQKHPELAGDLIRLAGQRMRWMGQQHNEQVFLSVPTRLARKLLHLASVDAACPETINLSQTELAEYVGATREAVSKTISGWKRMGVLEATRGALIIRDLDALRDLAEPEQI